jgi:hypothetical protein
MEKKPIAELENDYFVHGSIENLCYYRFGFTRQQQRYLTIY